MTPLEAYLTAPREIRSSGEAVDETAEKLKQKLPYVLLPKVNYHYAS